MPRKQLFLVSLGVLIAVGLAAGYTLYRPKTVTIGSERVILRDPVLKTGQALFAAGVQVDPADRVTPALEDWIPLDGNITVERAGHLYAFDRGALLYAAGVDSSAADLIDQAGVVLNPEDRVSWNGLPFDLSTRLPPGETYLLQIERAASFDLVENGKKSSLKTASPTLGHAMWELDEWITLRDRYSANPGDPLPAAGAAMDIQRARSLSITALGQTIHTRSTAATVGQVLAEAGVSLQGLDYSIPADDQPLPPDGAIRVVRVTEKLEFSQTIIPFESTLAPDHELELDLRRTLEPGQYGIQVSRERVRFEDGQEVSRTPDSDWTASEPKAQVLGYGTKVVPHTLETGDGTIEYYRAVNVYATAYSPCRLGRADYCNYQTANGSTLTKGIIAVSQAWYPSMVGQRVYIPGYGFGVIADTGYGIPGTPWIDLGYDDDNYVGGARNVTMYFLTPAPESVPWILP
jgi:uncharacterized protein YabE (DUF348 family)